jgi:large subunit ribosomal protein L25
MSQDAITLELDPRDVTGKAVKQLRSGGIVPAVIHDHGKPSVIVQGNTVAMLKVYRQAGKHHPIQLNAGGTKYTAMIKVAEFEPRKQMLTHIVFNAVSATQMVEAEVPIHARYSEGNESSPAERNNLLVISNIEVVMVKALANKLPDALYYDAEKLVEAGDHVTVADLIVPADVEIEAEANQTIATVYEPSAIAAANDSAGGDADEEADAEAAVEAAQGSVENTESPAAQATTDEAKEA